MRGDPAFLPESDFAMEKDGKMIGQNMFVRTVINADAEELDRGFPPKEKLKHPGQLFGQI